MDEALFWFEVEVMKFRYFENIVNRAFVVIEVGASGDPDVIHINPDCRSKGFVFEDNVLVNIVHHGLEGCWRVGESEVHDCRFEKSISCFKRHFRFVTFADAHIVVPPLDVELCVYVRIAEIMNEIHNKRKRILVSDRNGINFSIVLYQSHLAVLFANEEK